MLKKQNILRLQYKVILILFILVITFASTVYAEVPDCTVGDLTTGSWHQIDLPPGECPFPGPPTEDISDNYRIEGRYKMWATTSFEGWKMSPPSPRDECITGLAERLTAEMREMYEEIEDKAGGCSTYIASGTLLILELRGCSNPDYLTMLYIRSFDVPGVLQEWRCNTTQAVDIQASQGPPYCPFPQ